MSPRCGLVLVGWVLLIGTSQGSAEPEANQKLAQQAMSILRTQCGSCHDRNGKAKGGFDYVLDRERLVARQQLIPGKASESPLWQRIQQGEMPPPGKKPGLSKEEQALLQRWIDAGCAGPATTVVAAPTASEVGELIRKDLENLDPRQRRFARYFTLAHLAATGMSAEELQQNRHALRKLVNSLSWHPRITLPTAIDAAETVVRIDLRDYRWTSRVWDRLAAVYPYRSKDTAGMDATLTRLTGVDLPVLRADWFVATASRPPFYHDFLQLPNTDRALERLLNVDVQANLQDDNALRAGFNGSGVARSNRIIERHDAAHGAYWRSYDFSDKVGRQNIFEHPLGPGAGSNAFQHAGGEILFHLPNGLQAYFLVDARGQRVDKAPAEIVSDPKRPDRLVENGLSCLSCHSRGLLPKEDQVRAHVQKNSGAFAPADREAIKALYAPSARMRARMADDMKRFAEALARASVPEGDPEPIEAVTLSYEAVLDLPRAAGELGLSPQVLSQRLRDKPALSRSLGALLARGGTVQRQLFEENVAELIQSTRYEPKASLPRDAETLVKPGSPVRALAFAATGQQLATGSEDGIVRVWDEKGHEVMRLEGHREEVTAVVFCGPDRLLSAGRDRTVRLWDLRTGKQLLLLRGHTDVVRTVAASTDGKRALSGGDDRAVRLWDLERGEERAAWAGHGGPIPSVAISGDGRWGLSGSQDRSVRLWDLAAGKQAGRWEGHREAVHAVAFAPDGKQAASAGNDRVIVVWDVATGREVRRLSGHRNAIVTLRFGTDGKTLLSGSSQYTTTDRVGRVWNLATGAEIAGFEPAADERVETLLFAPDGKDLVLSDSVAGVRRHRLVPVRKEP